MQAVDLASAFRHSAGGLGIVFRLELGGLGIVFLDELRCRIKWFFRHPQDENVILQTPHQACAKVSVIKAIC
jgi:hypothetical protein